MEFYSKQDHKTVFHALANYIRICYPMFHTMKPSKVVYFIILFISYLFSIIVFILILLLGGICWIFLYQQV